MNLRYNVIQKLLDCCGYENDDEGLYVEHCEITLKGLWIIYRNKDRFCITDEDREQFEKESDRPGSRGWMRKQMALGLPNLPDDKGV